MSESGLEADMVGPYVSLVRQAWLEDVVRVSFHTVEKVIVEFGKVDNHYFEMPNRLNQIWHFRPFGSKMR